jgi:hypothetical protein
MEPQEPKKSFWVVPFAVQVTQGLIRDERSRRVTTGIALVVALVMVLAGLTVLRSWLDPHEHPWRFLFFWAACAWHTMLVLLLALLDLLVTRAEARQARNRLNREFSKSANENADD